MIHTRDGKTLAVLGIDQSITLFDTSSGKKLKTIGDVSRFAMGKGEFTGRLGAFYYGGGTLALSPDGKTIAQGWCNLVRFWDLETGKATRDPTDGHGYPVERVAISADGKTAVTLAPDYTARTWDLASGKQLHKSDLPLEMELASPLLLSTKRAVLRGLDETVRIWDLAAGKEIGMLAGFAEHRGIFQIAASLDGKTAAVTTQNQTIHIYSLETGKEQSVIKDLQSKRDVPGTTLNIFGLDINRDGSAVAVRLLEAIDEKRGTHTVRMYDLQTGKPLWEATVAELCRSFAFSHDGHYLALSLIDHSTTLLDAATGKERARFKVEGSSLAFSDDGHIMAVATLQGSIKLIDVRAGREIANFEGNQRWVESLTFSPDAGLLLSGGTDGTTLVWDTHELVRTARAPHEVDADMAKKLWADLGDDDTAKAWRAIAALIASPKQTLALATQQLRPAKAVEPARIDKWIAELDSEDFDVRQKAYNELSRIGGQAALPIKKALEANPPLEPRRRLQQLLERAAPRLSPLSPDTLRDIRAIEVLELIGTAEARAVLETLSAGAPGMRTTTEATTALKRIAK